MIFSSGIGTILIDNWVFTLVLLPLFIAMIKDSITRKYVCYRIYKKKLFKVGETLELYNPGDGTWEDVTIKQYCYSGLSDSKQFVLIEDDTGSLERFYLMDWSGVRKRKKNGKRIRAEYEEQLLSCMGLTEERK